MMTNKLFSFAIIIMAALFVLSGCSDKISNNDNQDVTISFKTHLGSQSSYFETNLFRLTVFIPENDITYQYNLQLVGGYIIGTIEVPVGESRVFTLTVLDTTVTPTKTIFRGSRTINVLPGVMTALSIPMYPQVPMIKLSPVYEEVPVTISRQGFTFDVDVSVYNLPTLGGISFSLLNDGGSPYLFDLVSTTLDPVIDVDCFIEWYSEVTNEFYFDIYPNSTGNYNMVDDSGYAHLATIRFRAAFTESQYEYGLSNFSFNYLSLNDSTGTTYDTTVDTVGLTVNRFNYDALVEGYWDMEQYPYFDTVYLDDASPNNLTTTAYFCDADEWSYSYAAKFDGDSSYIEVSDKTELDINDEMTISMWMKPDTVAHGIETILSKRSLTGSIDYEISYYRSETSEVFYLYFTVGTSVYRVPVDFSDGWWHYISFSHKFSQPNDIVANVDGITIIGHWMDGVSYDIPTGTFGDLQIGRYLYPSPGGYFTGSIDELRIVRKYFDADYLVQFYSPIGIGK